MGGPSWVVLFQAQPRAVEAATTFALTEGTGWIEFSALVRRRWANPTARPAMRSVRGTAVVLVLLGQLALLAGGAMASTCACCATPSVVPVAEPAEDASTCPCCRSQRAAVHHGDIRPAACPCGCDGFGLCQCRRLPGRGDEPALPAVTPPRWQWAPLDAPGADAARPIGLPDFESFADTASPVPLLGTSCRLHSRYCVWLD